MVNYRRPGSAEGDMTDTLPATRLRALHLDPRPRDGADTSICEDDPEEQPARLRRSHRARRSHPVDINGPHGCRGERATCRGVSAGCLWMRAGTAMAHMAMVYRRPAGVMRQSVKPQLASWDRAGHPSRVKLARFLAHVDAVAGPVLAAVRGRVAAELIVGFSEGVSLTDGGHDLGSYLFPVAQRLGPRRVAAMFGHKICGPSSPAAGPPRRARPAPPRGSRPAWQGPLAAPGGNTRCMTG